jgi:hypothetical protein
MPEPQRRCFVIMPFRPDLHYFYLYLKHHIEQKHGILCERGDTTVMTVPILDKINEYIRNADVLIADCSGRNPNVFYELGIAHAHGKKVILISQDPVQEAPADVRHYEFISYELGDHVRFLERLDNALRSVFFARYESFHERAMQVLSEFRKAVGMPIQAATKEIFLDRVIAAEREGKIPLSEDPIPIDRFLLPKVIADPTDYDVMTKVANWLSDR